MLFDLSLSFFPYVRFSMNTIFYLKLKKCSIGFPPHRATLSGVDDTVQAGTGQSERNYFIFVFATNYKCVRLKRARATHLISWLIVKRVDGGEIINDQFLIALNCFNWSVCTPAHSAKVCCSIKNSSCRVRLDWSYERIIENWRTLWCLNAHGVLDFRKMELECGNYFNWMQSH